MTIPRFGGELTIFQVDMIEEGIRDVKHLFGSKELGEFTDLELIVKGYDNKIPKYDWGCNW